MSDSSNGLRFGLIGCGLIGNKRAQAIQEPNRLVAVFDSDVARARALVATTRTSPEVCVSMSDFFSCALDAIIIATPHDSLASLTLRAVEAGFHVLCEKPGGIDSQEMAEVDRRSTALDRVVSIGFNHRFHPSLMRTFELVSSGEFGRFLWMRGRYGHGGRLGYESEWRADRKISGGGEMVDQGSHLIDLARFFLGDVELEYSRLETMFWPMDVEDNAFFALRPAIGGLAWLHTSWTEWKNTFSLEITLERAKIDISGLGGSYGPERLTLYRMSPQMGPPESAEYTWAGPDESWKHELEDFIGRIHGGTSRGATMRDAVEVRSIIEEAYST